MVLLPHSTAMTIMTSKTTSKILDIPDLIHLPLMIPDNIKCLQLLNYHCAHILGSNPANTRHYMTMVILTLLVGNVPAFLAKLLSIFEMAAQSPCTIYRLVMWWKLPLQKTALGCEICPSVLLRHV